MNGVRIWSGINTSYLTMDISVDVLDTRLPLNDQDIQQYIIKELEGVRLGANTFDPGATELIIRSAQGNLRLCRNLCYGSLIEAARENKKIVTITHVNNVLVQPHWRSHEPLIQQQVA